MNDGMDPFYRVLEDRHGWMRRYRANSGKKVAGYFCDYVPEEILHAAGMVPIRITGGRGNVVAADRYLQSNVCSFARRCLEQALTGVFDYLDAAIIPHTCDVITKMYDLWAYRMKEPAFLHYVWAPHKVFDENAPAVMEGEVRRLQQCAEQAVGKPITDDDLWEAIRVYDCSRALLKRVYELRRSSPPRISGVDAFAVSLSSLLTPKDLHIRWMKALLKERQADVSDEESATEPSKAERQTPRSGSGAQRRPRVMIAASVLDDLDLITAVEDAGAQVVADDVCTGSRYFWDRVGHGDEDPVKALTTRYLHKLPCPRSVGSLRPRTDHLLNLARDYAVEGVIFYNLRCCDAHLFQYPILHQRLRDAGLKVLYLQGEQTVGMDQALVNRVKAFTEMLSS